MNVSARKEVREMEKVIKLDSLSIVVYVDEKNGSASISDDLHEECSSPLNIGHAAGCKCGDCVEDRKLRDLFNASIDGITSLILAHAVAGIDVSSPEYVEGVESAYAACGHHFS